MMRRISRLNLAVVFALGFGSLAVHGCNDDCKDYYEPPSYRISVLDKETKVAICDAEVAVGDTPARKSSIDCTYVLEIPAGDSAVISAQADEYAPSMVTVPTGYDKDSCGHPIAKPVTVDLAKIP